MVDHGGDLDLALLMADRAETLAMAVFTGGPLPHETKADGSVVTESDRAIERELRAIVAAHRPGDAFVGEEGGGAFDGGGRRWIVDPIDGTHNFIAGRWGWCTQIGLADGDDLVLGVANFPALPGCWWGGVGEGAFARDDARSRPIRVGATPDGGAGRWASNAAVHLLDGERRRAVQRLEALGPYVEPDQWTTHPALMVAEGTIDICLQLAGEPWDYAGLAAVVQAAGGSFSYLDGSTVLGGCRPALFTSGADVHASALALLDNL
jgi:histidinol-phosphatase